MASFIRLKTGTAVKNYHRRALSLAAQGSPYSAKPTLLSRGKNTGYVLRYQRLRRRVTKQRWAGSGSTRKIKAILE